jgi:hypothetical protein
LGAVTLTAGSAVSPIDGKADGGKGGSISKTSIAATSVEGVTLTAGNGSEGAAKYNDNGDVIAGGAGGAGGSITDVALSLTDSSIATEFSLTAGSGGDGAFTENAGVGGSISGLALENLGSGTVNAGNGGNSAGTGNGGAGGSVSNISKFIASGDVVFTAGNGGSGQEGGAGGAGGSIGGTGAAAGTFTVVSGSLAFNAGAGGAGSVRYNANDAIVKSGAGGAGGLLAGLKLSVLDDAATLNFTGGMGGDGAGKAAGGKGGTVRDLTLAAPLGVGEFSIEAGAGGAAEDEDSALGGFGGDVLNVVLSGDSSIEYIAQILAGAGGAEDGSKDGSVSGVVLNGSSLQF